MQRCGNQSEAPSWIPEEVPLLGTRVQGLVLVLSLLWVAQRSGMGFVQLRSLLPGLHLRYRRRLPLRRQ